MSINPIVKEPSKVKDRIELEEILKKMDDYQTKMGDSGVLLIQNRQYGALWRICSRLEAAVELGKKVIGSTPEWGIEYLSRKTYQEIALRSISKRNSPCSSEDNPKLLSVA